MAVAALLYNAETPNVGMTRVATLSSMTTALLPSMLAEGVGTLPFMNNDAIT